MEVDKSAVTTVIHKRRSQDNLDPHYMALPRHHYYRHQLHAMLHPQFYNPNATVYCSVEIEHKLWTMFVVIFEFYFRLVRMENKLDYKRRQ